MVYDVSTVREEWRLFSYKYVFYIEVKAHCRREIKADWIITDDESVMVTMFMENCNLRIRIVQINLRRSSRFPGKHPICVSNRHLVLNSTAWVDDIVLKGMWKGRVNVGFPWLLTTTVTRHHLGRKQQFVLLLLLLLETFLHWHSAQWVENGKHVPVTHRYFWNSRTKFSSTFSFCRFSPLAGRLASGRTLYFCFSSEFGSGLAVRFEAGKNGRCVVSPAGLLQPSCSALTNRKRRLNGSHFSHQLVLKQQMPSWGFFSLSIMQLHFRRGNESPLWSRSIHSGNRS